MRSEQSVSVPGLAAASAAAADFDGDGDVDVATSCPALACVAVSLRQPNGEFVPLLNAAVPAARFLAAGDVDGDGLPDLVGTGEALWVALTSRQIGMRAPLLLAPARSVADHPVINELLAVNNALIVDADAGRNSDWLELFNGASTPVTLAGWRLSLIRTNASESGALDGPISTNTFVFPQDAPLEAGGHRLVLFTDKIRSPYHTGFPLPGTGATLCLFNPDNVEVDRVEYPEQQENISYSRFRDGMPSFMACNFPTPGAANTDSGPVRPTLDFEGLNWNQLAPNLPVRFFARSTDDVGVMGVVVNWRRLDLPNSPTNRLVLGDDGMSNDGAMLDGLFSGAIQEGLPAGGAIEFYLESMDVSELAVTAPGNPAFSKPGSPVTIYSLAVGAPVPPLEISEILADNEGGFRDEGKGTPDWIEIRNVSTQTVSLAGVSLSSEVLWQRRALDLHEHAEPWSG